MFFAGLSSTEAESQVSPTFAIDGVYTKDFSSESSAFKSLSEAGKLSVQDFYREFLALDGRLLESLANSLASGLKNSEHLLILNHIYAIRLWPDAAPKAEAFFKLLLSKQNFVREKSEVYLKKLDSLPTAILFYLLENDTENLFYLYENHRDFLENKLINSQGALYFTFLNNLIRARAKAESQNDWQNAEILKEIIQNLLKNEIINPELISKMNSFDLIIFWRHVDALQAMLKAGQVSDTEHLPPIKEAELSKLIKELIGSIFDAPNMQAFKKMICNSGQCKIDGAISDFLYSSNSSSVINKFFSELLSQMSKEEISSLLINSPGLVDDFYVFSEELIDLLLAKLDDETLLALIKTPKLGAKLSSALLRLAADLDNEKVLKRIINFSSDNIASMIRRSSSLSFANLFDSFLRDYDKAKSSECKKGKTDGCLGRLLEKISSKDISEALRFDLPMLTEALRFHSSQQDSYSKKISSFLRRVLNDLLEAGLYENLTGPGSFEDIYRNYDYYKAIIKKEKHLLKLLSFAAKKNALYATYILEQNANTMPKQLQELILDAVLQYIREWSQDRMGKEYSIIATIEYNSLIRIINNLHHAGHSVWRQKILDLLNPKQRYYLSVFGKEEIFTSTSSYVNYILPSIFKDIKTHGSLDDYLDKMDKSRKHLGDFVLIVTRYGKLNELLEISKSGILDLFGYLLNSNIGVEHAQALIALSNYAASFDTDKDLLAKMEELMYKRYSYFLAQKDYLSAEKLSTIASLYLASAGKVQSKSEEVSKWLKDSSARQDIKIPQEIYFQDLYQKEGNNWVHRELWFFAESGDLDGIRSRYSAFEHLKKASFKAEYLSVSNSKDKKDILIVMSRQIGNKRVEVFLSPILDTKTLLKDLKAPGKLLGTRVLGYLADNKFSVLTYRGHSTFVPMISELLKALDLAQDMHLSMFNLGSCGGLSSISKISEALPNMPVAWIATQATGSARVNDAIYSKMLLKVLELNPGESINFKSFKKELEEGRLGKDRAFKSYRLPHENLPAILKAHFERLERKYKISKIKKKNPANL